ncbi:sulfite exporter TauE/SafE family protein [Chloroflexota bacterium]
MEFHITIALRGLVIGVLIGLSGMGGGALMTPLLILLGVRPVIAVGTDLVVMTVTKCFGAWQHRRLGNVDYRFVLLLALGSVPGALAGVGTLAMLREVAGISVDVFVSRLLGAVLVLVALVLMGRFPILRFTFLSPAGTDMLPRSSVGRHIIPFLGLVVGFLVGLSSVGSGTLLVAVLSLLFRAPMARIIGVDVAHGALLTAAAGAAHLSMGNVDLMLAANVLLGTIPGVFIGSRLSGRIPDRRLGTILALVLFGLGVNLLYTELY